MCLRDYRLVTEPTPESTATVRNSALSATKTGHANSAADGASAEKAAPCCPDQGHHMVMSEGGGHYRDYICNECKISANGSRWFCALCKSDYCYSCHPASNPKLKMQPTPKTWAVAVMCPEGLESHEFLGMVMGIAPLIQAVVPKVMASTIPEANYTLQHSYAAVINAANLTVAPVSTALPYEPDATVVSAQSEGAAPNALVEGATYDVAVFYKNLAVFPAVNATSKNVALGTAPPGIAAPLANSQHGGLLTIRFALPTDAMPGTVNVTLTPAADAAGAVLDAAGGPRILTLSPAWHTAGTGTLAAAAAAATPLVLSPNHLNASTTDISVASTDVVAVQGDPILVEGAVYHVTLGYRDIAGYAAASTTVQNVTLRASGALVSQLNPRPRVTRGETIPLSFVLPERPLANSTVVTLTQTSGSTADSGSPHEIYFVGDAFDDTTGDGSATSLGANMAATLNSTSLAAGATKTATGAIVPVTLANSQARLVHGAVYSVALAYRDAIGNPAASIQSNAEVELDLVTDTPTLSSPLPGALVGMTLDVIFDLPEVSMADSVVVAFNCTSGCGGVLVRHTLSLAGVQGPGSITLPLRADGLAATNATASAGAVLVDDADYSITVLYRDALGNDASVSAARSISVNLEASAPTLTRPTSSVSIARTVDVDFTTNTTTAPGKLKLTFTRTGGTADAGSPHVVFFSSEAEAAGRYRTTLSVDALSRTGAGQVGIAAAADAATSANPLVSRVTGGAGLVAGCVYDVVLEMTDLYGNIGTSTTASSVRVASTDTTLSALTIVAVAGNGTSALDDLVPPFESATRIYDLTVPSSAASLAITAPCTNLDRASTLVSTAEAPTAVTVAGRAGQVATVDAAVGLTNVTITVVAEDGVTTDQYVVQVVRVGFPEEEVVITSSVQLTGVSFDVMSNATAQASFKSSLAARLGVSAANIIITNVTAVSSTSSSSSSGGTRRLSVRHSIGDATMHQSGGSSSEEVLMMETIVGADGLGMGAGDEFGGGYDRASLYGGGSSDHGGGIMYEDDDALIAKAIDDAVGGGHSDGHADGHGADGRGAVSRRLQRRRRRLSTDAVIVHFRVVSTDTASAEVVAALNDAVVNGTLSAALQADDAVTFGTLTTIVTIQAPTTSVEGRNTLAYSPASAGAVTQITVDFRLNVQLQAGDRIRLTLPGFTGSAATFASTGVSSTGSLVLSFSGTWDPTTTALQFAVAAGTVVPQSTQVRIVVPQAVGIALPTSGLAQNDPSLLFESLAVAGSISPGIPVTASPPVGSLAVVLSYTPARARYATALGVSLTSRATIADGEKVTLTLANFTKAGQQASDGWVLLTLAGADAEKFTARWREGGSTGGSYHAQLELTVSTASGAGIVASVPAVFEVPLTAGVTLPVTGLSANSAGLTVETDAAAGPVTPAQAIGSSPFVPAIFNDRIAYQPYGLAGMMPTEFLTVEFAFNADLVERDTITVTFGGFSGVSSPRIDSGKFLGAWDASTTQLQLVVKDAQSIPANTISQVIISNAVQIRIPTGGHPINTEQITIGCVSSAGTVVAVPVQASPPVAVFTSTSLAYNPPTAGATTELTIGFTFLVIGLQAGDTITLRLPGFGGAATTDIVPTGTDGAKFTASWSGADTTTNTTSTTSGTTDSSTDSSTSSTSSSSSLLLTIKEGMQVNADSAVVLVIPASAGITLPTAGLAQNEPTLNIKATTSISQVNPSSIESSPPVGAFSSSSITLRSLLAGVVTHIEMRWQLTVALAATQKVEVTLNGFTGGPTVSALATEDERADVSAYLGGAHGSYFTGRWNATTAVLVLTMKAQSLAIAASTNVIVTLSEEAGIRTPYDGIRRASSGLMIGSDAALGPVNPAVPVSTFSEIAPGLADVGVYAAIDGVSYALMGVNLRVSEERNGAGEGGVFL